MKHVVAASLLLILASRPALATDDPLLSLETIRACDFSLAWQDKGSGGDNDIALYTPRVPAGYFMIGAYAQGDYHRVAQCVIAARPAPDNSATSTPLLVEPQRWQAIWFDKGTGADMDGSVWRAIPPHPDYVCTGDVGQGGYHAPRLATYRCLHKCLVEEVPVPRPIWTDSGTGARNPVSLYVLRNSKGFYAMPDRNSPGRLLDIKSNPSCSTDLESVISAPSSAGKSTAPASHGKAQKQTTPPGSSRQWVNPDEVRKQPAGQAPRTNKEWVNPDEVY